MPENNPTPAVAKKPASGTMQVLYHEREVYLWNVCHNLGQVRRDLSTLKQQGLICNEVTALEAQGYRGNLGIGPGENLPGLASGTFGRLLKSCPHPRALVFHHSYPDSTFLPGEKDEAGFMSRVHYFPPVLMQQFKLDQVPYLVSFGSGCTGLLSMVMTAAGLLDATSSNPVLCMTADVKPAGTTYDALREKILTSDCSSGFLVGREKRGFKILGISYYSTTRQIVPLVEIVKRSVQMIRELAASVNVDLSASEVYLHYPNIFTTAWDMVTQYLQVPKERQIIDGLAERAHCLSSDSMISLEHLQGHGAGRIHVVLNFGSGLHLGACLLREEAAA